MKFAVICSLAAALGIAGNSLFAQTNSAAQAEEKAAAYRRVIAERTAKILATLEISEIAKSNRVQQIIEEQYHALNGIQTVRDLKIENAKRPAHVITAQEAPGVNQVQTVQRVSEGAASLPAKDERTAVNTAIQAARDEAKVNLDKLHGEFLSKLSAELSPEQIDKVKDGMTYGVLGVTYNAYLKSFPTLTDEQKAQLKAWLIEAREIAMDQGSSQEKHAVFGKYKGRINNYLVKAGYDLKEGERNLRKTNP